MWRKKKTERYKSIKWHRENNCSEKVRRAQKVENAGFDFNVYVCVSFALIIGDMKVFV